MTSTSPETLAWHYFDEQARLIKQLDGYDNCNYLMEGVGGKFVLKTYTATLGLEAELEAEGQALQFLHNHFPSFPRPIPIRESGEWISSYSADGKPRLIRALSYVEGELMADVDWDTALIASFGTLLAKTNAQLQTFDHAGIRARKLDWDLSHYALCKPMLRHIADPALAKRVRHSFLQLDMHYLPVAQTLRQQSIHGDANDWNVLVADGKAHALIDFGDMSHGPLVHEIAIALSYIHMRETEPMDLALPFLEAYHAQYPLLQEELEMIYYLVAGRLAMSLCHAARSSSEQPENSYTSAHENAAAQLLKKWIAQGYRGYTNTLLHALGFHPKPVMTASEALERRQRSLSKILSVSNTEPVYMERAAFQYMFDKDGRRYLDAYNNIPHVGHQHPAVVEAAQRQMALLNTNTRYLYDNLASYAEELLSYFPANLSKVFFVNSGSEASDLAIRLARFHTRREDIMVVEHGYHGHTQNGIDISDYKFSHTKGQGQRDYILKTALPDVYRAPENMENVGRAYADHVGNQLEYWPNPMAAFIAEPVVGCGGQVPLAPGYLQQVYPKIRAMGGLCISDEVQTGFGRLGSHMWGFEMHGVVPDIVVLGKPMGNGHPMGAVVCTEEVAQSFEQGVEFFSSFGGNPVSCEVGKAVLQIMKDENLRENALKIGAYYREELQKLALKHEAIGDVRGSGLFLGIELVKDRSSKEHHTTLAQFLKNEARRNYILLSTDGPKDSVIKTKPPLCFSKENVDEVIAFLDTKLKKYP